MARTAIQRRRQAEWARFGAGFLCALLNGLAIMATLVGVLAQSIRDQEHGSAYAPVFHVGYPVLNGLAIYYVLSQLGDETRSARTTILVWSLGTLTLWAAYWSWVL